MFDKIFNGGLSNHPKRGHLCKVAFAFEVDHIYFVVEFEDGSFEICTSEFIIDAF